jgi:uncharacterized membrane protein
MAEQQKREEEIERHAREIGRLIREADPETQEELIEAASAIMREEAQVRRTEESPHPERQRKMNPMAAGLGLLVIGVGLAFLMPAVGVVLIIIGFAALIWGVVITGFKK